MKEKRERILYGVSAIILLTSVVILYVAHRAVPFMMDDLWYSTMLSSEEPITSLGDIVQSQIWHYHNWGGRSMTHGMLQMILLSGEEVADVLNVLVTLLLSAMICVVAGKKSIPFFLAAFGMVFGLNANWKMSMFWQAGAANYLYITVFILLFLHCYLREIDEPENTEGLLIKPVKNHEMVKNLQVKNLPWIIVWIIPLGLMAGWSNENMGPAVCLISAIITWLQWRETGRVKVWMPLGVLASFVGSILVVAAPGNFVRSAEAAANEKGFLWNLFLRFYGEGQAALNFLFPALLLTAVVWFLGKNVLGIPVSRKNRFLCFGALLSWGAMFLSPHYPDRATFGTMVLMICFVLSMAVDILQKRREMKFGFWWISLLIWARGIYYLMEYLAICWGWI